MIFSGLDLGQAKDNTALACADRIALAPSSKETLVTPKLDAPEPRFRYKYLVRHLQVWPLGTAYTTIATDLAKLYTSKALAHTALALDYVGVGRPVYDQLRAARVPARLVPILTTGGKVVSHDEARGVWNVPKGDLAAALRAKMEQRNIVIEQSLKLRSRMETEMAKFQVTISRAKNELLGASASQHDDLIFALMLSIWLAERDGGGWGSGVGVPEEGEGTSVETAPDGVFASRPEYHRDQSGSDRFGVG